MKLSETYAVSGMLAKLKDAPIVPVCTAAAIGFLSGAVIGFVFSPIKHGIVIGSYNTTTVDDEKKDKKGKNTGKRKASKQKQMEHYILADES